jgi:oligoribonuclease NrnB/cAMP/cGMP phosphodiesterase (DHH superfamily)
MSKIYLYHSADHDGLACGAMMAAHGLAVKGYNYKEPLPCDLADIGGMADVSLTAEQMVEWSALVGKGGIWLDHHADIYAQVGEQVKANGVTVLFEKKQAACYAVFDWLYGSRVRKPFNLIEISRYDTWQHQTETLNHHLGWHLRVGSKLTSTYNSSLFDDEIYRLCIQDGRVLALARQRDYDSVRRRKVIWAQGIAGIEGLIYNGVMDSVNCRADIKGKCKFVASYIHIGGDVWQWSVRSVDKGTAQRIAKSFGGNGHPDAAGFRTTTHQMVLLTQEG